MLHWFNVYLPHFIVSFLKDRSLSVLSMTILHTTLYVLNKYLWEEGNKREVDEGKRRGEERMGGRKGEC